MQRARMHRRLYRRLWACPSGMFWGAPHARAGLTGQVEGCALNHALLGREEEAAAVPQAVEEADLEEQTGSDFCQIEGRR